MLLENLYKSFTTFYTEDLVGHAVMAMVYQEIVYVMAQVSALIMTLYYHCLFLNVLLHNCLLLCIQVTCLY